MSDPNLNLGIGGGQPPLGPSYEDDEKALKKGNTLVLVLGAVAALVVGGGLMVLLLSGEDSEPYEAIGRQVNGMKTEHFDGFWACALPGMQLDDLRSDQDLRREIQERAERRPNAYARHVREECIVKLNEHEPRLRQLLPPSDLSGQLESLTTSLNELRAGWNGYVDELSRAEDGYDEDTMAPHVSKIAKGWYDYRSAHGEINTAIRGHLE